MYLVRSYFEYSFRFVTSQEDSSTTRSWKLSWAFSLLAPPTICKANLMTTKEEKCRVFYHTRKATTKRNVEPAEQFLFRCHRCRWWGEISAASSHQQPTVSGTLVNEMRTGKKCAKGNLAADKISEGEEQINAHQSMPAGRTANGSRFRAASCD